MTLLTPPLTVSSARELGTARMRVKRGGENRVLLQTEALHDLAVSDLGLGLPGDTG